MTKAKFIIVPLFLIALHCIFSSSILAQPQNPKWVIPPHIVDFSQGFSITPLPGGISSYINCNGAFDQSGNLLFFVVDDQVYDNMGNPIGSLWTYSGEINIVKVPESCHQYYLIYQESPPYEYSL